MMARITNDEQEENNSESKDIYDEEGIDRMTDDDEIEGWEAGFMQGAAGEGKGAKCRRCGKIFGEGDTVLEKDIDGERYRFCSDECVEEFLEKKKDQSKKTFKSYKN